MFLLDLFQHVIYQPFFNILVGIYWMLGLGTEAAPDMGIAVILLTLLIRILLLPMSIAGHRSEAERREIAEKVKEIEERYASDPIRLKKEKKAVFRRNRGVFNGEVVSLFIQVAIALMLWRIFETGLKGDDLHLIYGFMPEVELPFNLMFLGRFDLSKTNFFLNLLQSILIFVVETLAVLTSPFPTTRKEVVRLQLTLPVVSFLIFMRLPAGKKLFVITTLVFSFFLLLGKFIWRRFHAYKDKVEQQKTLQEGGEQVEEKVVVEVK